MLPVLDTSTSLGVLIDSDVDAAYVLLYFLLGKCALLRILSKYLIITTSYMYTLPLTAATTSLKKKTKEKLNLCRARLIATCFDFSELNRKREMHFSSTA